MQNTIVYWIKRLRFTLAFLTLFLAWLWLRPEPPAQIYALHGQTMGTTYSVQVAGFPAGVSDAELAEGIAAILYRADRELMSTYNPDSELSRFNSSEPGVWFDVSPELAVVVDQALKISEQTGGYFDVTIGPLVDRWGFGPRRAGREGAPSIPDADEISALQAAVGYHHLQVSLQPPQLRKTAPVQVDLSGIAKGYGADMLADYLDAVGQDSYFVEVGGELRIRGLKPDGSAWVPAIETPLPGQSQVWQVLNTHGEALALGGSGDYRNYFEVDGQRYSHEIDPFSGRPVTHNLAAAYVIAPTAMLADAYTTALMVMGPERGRALAEQIGLAAYFIVKLPAVDDFDAFYTSAFSRYLEESP